MAKAFGVSPRTMKRWLIGMGFSIGEPADHRLGQRRQAFSLALEYANTLKVYPPSGEIEGMAVRTFPFHREDLVEMIETRKHRGLTELKRRKRETVSP